MGCGGNWYSCWELPYLRSILELALNSVINLHLLRIKDGKVLKAHFPSETFLSFFSLEHKLQASGSKEKMYTKPGLFPWDWIERTFLVLPRFSWKKTAMFCPQAHRDFTFRGEEHSGDELPLGFCVPYPSDQGLFSLWDGRGAVPTCGFGWLLNHRQ